MKGYSRKFNNQIFNIGDCGYVIVDDKKYKLNEPLCSLDILWDECAKVDYPFKTYQDELDEKTKKIVHQCRKITLKDLSFQESKQIENSNYKAFIYKINNINPDGGGYYHNVLSSHFYNILDGKEIKQPSFSYYTMLNTNSAILTIYVTDEEILKDNKISFIIPV